MDLEEIAEDLLDDIYTLMWFREGPPSEGQVIDMILEAFERAREFYEKKSKQERRQIQTPEV